jgi:hypothetical protein
VQADPAVIEAYLGGDEEDLDAAVPAPESPPVDPDARDGEPA